MSRREYLFDAVTTGTFISQLSEPVGLNNHYTSHSIKIIKDKRNNKFSKITLGPTPSDEHYWPQVDLNDKNDDGYQSDVEPSKTKYHWKGSKWMPTPFWI